MKILASLLVLVITLASNACAESFRIATYNVNWGNRRGDKLLDAITSADADLICFQETTIQSERFLRERLGKSHPHFHSVGYQGRYAAERFAFASKVELKEVAFIPPAAGLFGFYTAKLNVAGNAIHIFNVHLTPFQFKRGNGFPDAMAALSTTEEQHAAEIDAIVDGIDPLRPTVIVGDFNSLSNFCAPRKLAELGFVDAFASVHEHADANPTWNWPTQPMPLKLRIDYIFHTPHFTTTESEIIRRDCSDHSLVYAELEYGAPSDAHEAADSAATNEQTTPTAR